MTVTTVCGILLVLSCKEQLDQPKCGKPEEVYGNARLKTDIGQLDEFSDGYEVLYRCLPGHVTSSSLNRICSNGTWNPIQCFQRFCPNLDDPENGERLDRNSLPGDRTTFRCHTGYNLKGAPTLLCRTDGQWRPNQPPICDPVKCPDISWIRNGRAYQIAPDRRRNIFDRVVTFSCDTGFRLNGSKSRRCQADGTWSGMQPTCEVPSCPELPPLYYGEIYYESEGLQKSGDAAEISCDEGIDLFPEDFNGYVFCDGIDKPMWTFSDFTCEARHSVGPGANMKLYVLGRYLRRVTNQETFKSRTKLSAECDPKYEMFDNKDKKYTNQPKYDFEVFNGTVKPAFPVCKGKRCKLQECKETCSYMYISGYPVDGLVEHQVNVTKACKEEYEFTQKYLRQRASYTTTCDKGQISFPRCIRKRCLLPTGKKGDDIKSYSPGDLINDGITVRKSCTSSQELYHSDTKTYLNLDRFETKCNVGKWSKPNFPVCVNKRCKLKECKQTCSYIGGYPPGGLVEHQVKVTKTCKEDHEFIPENLRQRVFHTSTCDKGKISFPECIPKRCIIPTGEKGDDIKSYLSGNLVNDGVIVKKSCIATKELKRISGTYLDRDAFETKCTAGKWFDPDFPVCENKRCTVKYFNGSRLIVDDAHVIAGEKVPHGTTVDIECVVGYENQGSSQAVCDKGKLLEDDPCRPKSCEVHPIKNSEQDKRSKTLDHGQTLNLSCEATHNLVESKDHSYVGSVESRCLYGNFTVTLDGFICEPRGCTPLANANLTLVDKMGKPLNETTSSFGHDQYASIKCNDKFVLISGKDGTKLQNDAMMTTKCVYGDWEPRYKCRTSSCEYEPPKRGYLSVLGQNWTETVTIDSGTKGKIMCHSGYNLYNVERSQSYQSYAIQCNGNEITAPKLVCIRRCELVVNEGQTYTYLNGEVVENQFIPSKENVILSCGRNYTLVRDGKDHARSFAQQQCKNGKLRPRLKCKLKEDTKKMDDEEIVTTTDISTEVSLQVTSELPFTVTAQQKTTPDDYFEYYAYEYENAREDQNNCSAPMNGMMKLSFLKFYDVTCDKGFKLNNFDNDHRYECVNGKLLNIYNKEAKCTESECVLNRELLSNINVFGNKSRNAVFLSPNLWFDPGRELFFNCKNQTYEPVNRKFQCRKGQWIAADEDPNWTMIIDSVNSSCRPAKCNQCVFGDCIKDGECKCHQGAKGKNCATPVCDELCKKNEGRCVRPNICVCPASRYGDNCEQVGCTLPPENGHLRFKKDGLPEVFEKDAMLSNEKLSCSDDFLLSTDKDLICNGDKKWSEDVSCIPGAIYEIEVTVGYRRWGGSWNTLYVSFINGKGQKTPKMFIQSVLYQGKTYKARSLTHHIGEIKRLNFILNGTDSLYIHHISLNVTRGGQIEEYTIQRGNWIQKDALLDVDHGCPPPSSIGTLVHPKQRYIIGHKLSEQDVQCESGYSTSTAVCQSDGKWSRDSICQKAIKEYDMVLSAYRATRSKITVALHGARGSTKELTFLPDGIGGAGKFHKKFKETNLGQITGIEIRVDSKFRDKLCFQYIQLSDQRADKRYVFFKDGCVQGSTRLSVSDLYRPGCIGHQFLRRRDGFCTKNYIKRYGKVSSEEECKSLCLEYMNCAVAQIQYYRGSKHCDLFSSSNTPSECVYERHNQFYIHFRKCS